MNLSVWLDLGYLWVMFSIVFTLGYIFGRGWRGRVDVD